VAQLRIALLILAYRAPVVLQAQLKIYAGTDAAVYVHLDSKAKDEDFLFLRDHKNVTLAPTRIDCYWGGFTLVRCALLLLEMAVRDGFDQYVLISDDSFPLLRMGDIKAMLAGGINVIGNPVGPEYQRYARSCYFDCPATAPNGERRTPGLFSPAQADDLADLAALMRSGKKALPIIFHCAQWWAMTHQAAQRVLAVDRQDKHLRDSFRFSEIPDESYIQTIAGTEFPERFVHRNLMWFDFSREPKPFVFETLDGLQQAIDSRHAFARKIAPAPQLLAALEERLVSSA